MIHNLEDYENEINYIMERIPLCRTAQLEKALKNIYEDMDDEFARQTLMAIQRRGHIFLSTDGWAMTKGMYLRLTQDRGLDAVNSNENFMHGFRLADMQETIVKNKAITDEIDCLWLAIDMLPDSRDFIVGCHPWLISFDTFSNEKYPSRLFQITKIPADKELTRCEILRTLPKIENDDLKKVTTRLALIEDERHAWMVPHIGFTYICVLDPENERGYRIVERRSGNEVWGE